MHGMPHARLLLWQSLLRGHDAAYSCHGGSSHMGLARPGYETLVTGQLGLHLLLEAEKQSRARTHTKETPPLPSQCTNKQPNMGANVILPWPHTAKLIEKYVCVRKQIRRIKNIARSLPTYTIICSNYYLLCKGKTRKHKQLTSEISSSGWINLLVALVVVRVAGLLVTVAGGLATGLLEELEAEVEEEEETEDWV